MRLLILTTLFLIFAAVHASPVHIKARADAPPRTIGSVSKEDVAAYKWPRRHVASGKIGGVVETTIEKHPCQILKLERSLWAMRDMTKEFNRLKVAKGFNGYKIDVAGGDYFFLEKGFFSSQPPQDISSEKLKQMWKEAGEAFDVPGGDSRQWDTYLHSTDPESFVYHGDSLAIFIGPPTARDKSTQLQIDQESFKRILGSAQLISRGTDGELKEATLDERTGQILVLKAKPSSDLQSLVRRLYQSDQVEGYVKVGDSYYFFLLERRFTYEVPKDITPEKLRQMRKNALTVCNIKTDKFDSNGFLYNSSLDIAIYIGRPYAAIVVSQGPSHTVYTQKNLGGS